MCGIAIQYKDNHVDPWRIAHRGIEQGTVKTGDYTLFHTRLPLQTSIGDQYHQPIKLSGGRYLMFNGEIFNHPEEYENDVSFLVHFFSDPNWMNLLLAGAADSWDGFWAICIVEENKMYAFTDPLGKKQLYYRRGCIASEIKPLLEHVVFDPDFNWDDPVITRRTPFLGVRRIRPNYLYEFKDGAFINMYGAFPLVDLRRAPLHKDLKKLLSKAVQQRHINLLDNNTLFVSGGLDSTIILSHFKGTRAMDNLDLISIDNGESEYVDIVEDWIGKEVRRVPSIGMSENPLYWYEYPIEKGSLFPQYNLCKETKGSVIYTGDGADELFSGYSRAQRYDSQEFDIFTELPYYHNIRIDRMGMAFTKEIRCPFMSHDLVRLAVNTPWSSRKSKIQLKEAYKGIIPEGIINRSKSPLRIESMALDREKYSTSVKNIYKSINFKS